MDERGGFVQKILFIHTVFIYTGCVHFVPFGGRKFDRRNEVLAETGGAVSALTPREHTVLRQQRAVTGPRGNAWLSAAPPLSLQAAGREAVHGKDELSARADAAGDRQG
ncbi:hypothetical protein BHS30_23740 [Klebsiella pneumoniae]|nr:hypothetical protein BHS30_23740 [Klebsiella pneumoniae]